VLQLVEKGLVKLTDAAATHVDPALRQLNGTTLHAHFGDWIDGVTIENLLHMTSGVADYDGQA
jgi:CubicO group peptidase (beta-lactamase class C family)